MNFKNIITASILIFSTLHLYGESQLKLQPATKAMAQSVNHTQSIPASRYNVSPRKQSARKKSSLSNTKEHDLTNTTTETVQVNFYSAQTQVAMAILSADQKFTIPVDAISVEVILISMTSHSTIVIKSAAIMASHSYIISCIDDIWKLSAI